MCRVALSLLLITALPHVTHGATEATAPAEGYSQGRCSEFPEKEPATGIIFVVVALFVGLVSYHVLAFIPVPYTAILLVRPCADGDLSLKGSLCASSDTRPYIKLPLPQAFGAVLGVANEAGAHWDVLAEGICLWEVTLCLHAPLCNMNTCI